MSGQRSIRQVPEVWKCDHLTLHIPHLFTSYLSQVYQQLIGGIFATLEKMAAMDAKHGERVVSGMGKREVSVL